MGSISKAGKIFGIPSTRMSLREDSPVTFMVIVSSIEHGGYNAHKFNKQVRRLVKKEKIQRMYYFITDISDEDQATFLHALHEAHTQGVENVLYFSVKFETVQRNYQSILSSGYTKYIVCQDNAGEALTDVDMLFSTSQTLYILCDDNKWKEYDCNPEN